MKQKLLLYILTIFITLPVLAQGDDMGYGVSVGADRKIVKGLKVSAEAEVRSQNQFADFERWTFGLGIDYKALDWLKVDAGYAFINRYKNSVETAKGNIINGFWGPRHRWYGGFTGSVETKRWKFSLRERYQYTYSPMQYVPKYGDDGKRLTDEEAGGSDHVLRSRLQAVYNIRHSKFSPFASVEMINDLTSGFAIDQMRYTLGTDYKLNKASSLSIQWRFKDRADNDESNGHLFTLGYNYSF